MAFQMCMNSIWKRGGWTFNVLLAGFRNAIEPHFHAMWCIFSHHHYFRECIGLRWVQKAKKLKSLAVNYNLFIVLLICEGIVFTLTSDGGCMHLVCVSGRKPLTWSIDHTARLAVLSDNSEKLESFFFFLFQTKATVICSFILYCTW